MMTIEQLHAMLVKANAKAGSVRNAANLVNNVSAGNSLLGEVDKLLRSAFVNEALGEVAFASFDVAMRDEELAAEAQSRLEERLLDLQKRIAWAQAEAPRWAREAAETFLKDREALKR